MPLAITNYDFSVFLHISAVVVGFGSTFSESVMFPVAMKMSARHLPYVHRLQLVLNQFFVIPAVVIIAASGIYQMEEGNWDYGDLWVSATITILVIVTLINIFFFIPADRKLLPIIQKAVADAGDRELGLADLPPTYQRLGRAEGIMGGLTGILLIAAIFFMTTKPGL
jgi:predicted Kef-type K+ transport protein